MRLSEFYAVNAFYRQGQAILQENSFIAFCQDPADYFFTAV